MIHTIELQYVLKYYVLYVVRKYLYPLITICHISLSLLAVKLFKTKWMLKGKCPRLLKMAPTTLSHIHAQMHALVRSNTRRHARTHRHTTYVFFKPCIYRKHGSILKSTLYNYVLICIYSSVLCVCILRIYYFSIYLFVYNATCKQFIV